MLIYAGKWEDMEVYANMIPTDSYDSSFFRAVINIHANEFQKARQVSGYFSTDLCLIWNTVDILSIYENLEAINKGKLSSRINYYELKNTKWCICLHTHTHTHTSATILWLFGFCPGQPGWTSTRRNIHPLTLIVVINHPYLLPPSTTIHGILPIQSSLFTVFLHITFFINFFQIYCKITPGCNLCWVMKLNNACAITESLSYIFVVIGALTSESRHKRDQYPFS